MSMGKTNLKGEVARPWHEHEHVVFLSYPDAIIAAF